MAGHPIINVHTHTFNFTCVPDGFLSNYVKRGVAFAAGKALRTRILGGLVRWIVQRLPMTRKFATLVAIGTKRTQLDVFEGMLQSYSGVDSYFIVLPMNFDYMGGGSMPASYVTQLAELEQVKRQYQHRIIPFLGIDPRMGNAGYLLNFVKQYFEPKPGITRGYAGIKLYPSLGFFPFDPRLKDVYAYAADHGIPIQTHCTRQGAFYAGRKLPNEILSFDSFNRTAYTANRHTQKQYIDMAKLPLKDSCDNYLDPVNYLDVLDRFPDLKLCFAHFGGDDEMLRLLGADSQPFPTHASAIQGFEPGTSWHNIILYIMKEYKNVYSDISYTLYNDKIWDMLNSLLAGKLAIPAGEEQFRSSVPNRILFGTDYFMTTQEKQENDLYNDFIKQLNRLPDAWEQISWKNPKRYLESDFFAVKE